MSAFGLFEVDFDLFDLAVEPERAPVEIVERDRRAEIDADVEGLARGKRRRHGALDRGARDLLAVDLQHDVCRRQRLRARELGRDLDPVLAGGELRASSARCSAR